MHGFPFLRDHDKARYLEEASRARKLIRLYNVQRTLIFIATDSANQLLSDFSELWLGLIPHGEATLCLIHLTKGVRSD